MRHNRSPQRCLTAQDPQAAVSEKPGKKNTRIQFFHFIWNSNVSEPRDGFALGCLDGCCCCVRFFSPHHHNQHKFSPHLTTNRTARNSVQRSRLCSNPRRHHMLAFCLNKESTFSIRSIIELSAWPFPCFVFFLCALDAIHAYSYSAA